MGIVGPGSPGLYEAGQLAVLKDDLEYVMASVPWAELQEPADPAGGRGVPQALERQDLRHQLRLLLRRDVRIADVLERAKSTDPDAIVDALKKTNYGAGLMQYGGPVVFNDLGDNPNAITTMIQILGQKPVAVWPKEAALQKFVFPRPKR